MAERLSAQMRFAAEQLASEINAGEYAPLTAGQRFDLRQLSLAIAGWSDRVATLEAELAESPRTIIKWRWGLPRWVRLLLILSTGWGFAVLLQVWAH